MEKYYRSFYYAILIPLSILSFSIVISGLGQFLYANTQWEFAIFLVKMKNVCTACLPLLLSASIAYFTSKQRNGNAVFSGVISFIIVAQILNPNTLKDAFLIDYYDIDISFSYINNPLLAILCGTLSAKVYDHFYNVQLPSYLSFFSGKRCVPIITALCTIIVAWILYFIWPLFFHSFYTINQSLFLGDALSKSVSVLLNQLLSLFGFHNFIQTFIVTPTLYDSIYLLSLFAIPICFSIIIYHYKSNRYFIGIFLVFFISSLLQQQDNYLIVFLLMVSPILWIFHCFSIALVNYLLLTSVIPPLYMAVLMAFLYFTVCFTLIRSDKINGIQLENNAPPIPIDTLRKSIEALGNFENIKSIEMGGLSIIIQVYDYEYVDFKKIKALTDWSITQEKNDTLIIVPTMNVHVLSEMISFLQEEERQSLLL